MILHLLKSPKKRSPVVIQRVPFKPTGGNEKKNIHFSKRKLSKESVCRTPMSPDFGRPDSWRRLATARIEQKIGGGKGGVLCHGLRAMGGQAISWISQGEALNKASIKELIRVGPPYQWIRAIYFRPIQGVRGTTPVNPFSCKGIPGFSPKNRLDSLLRTLDSRTNSMGSHGTLGLGGGFPRGFHFHKPLKGYPQPKNTSASIATSRRVPLINTAPNFFRQGSLEPPKSKVALDWRSIATVGGSKKEESCVYPPNQGCGKWESTSVIRQKRLPKD